MQDESCYGTEHQLAVKDDKGCRTYPLTHPTYEVGRFAKLDIRLCTRSHQVARHHATLVQVGQPPFDYQLIAAFSPDDSGAHQLLVNANPIQTHVLSSGDIIEFGAGVSAIYNRACPVASDFDSFPGCILQIFPIES